MSDIAQWKIKLVEEITSTIDAYSVKDYTIAVTQDDDNLNIKILINDTELSYQFTEKSD